MPIKLYFLTIILFALIAVNVFFVVASPPVQEEGLAAELLSSSEAYVLPVSEPSFLPVLVSNERPVIDARAGVVYDTSSGRFLFSKNARTQMPIASLTKIMTAIMVIERLDPSDVVTVPLEVIRVDGEKQTLYRGERISVLSLLKMLLIESSNDAAFALGHHFQGQTGEDLIEAMNEKAAFLHMTETKFADPAGLSDEGYSTAEDLIKLIRHSLRRELMWNIMSEKSTVVTSVDGKIEHKLENTNQLLGVIPNVAGGKTGYTDVALGALVLVVDIPGKNDKIVSIVLGSRERFNDSSKLIDWAKSSYRWE